MEELLSAPPPTHLVYIPVILLVGGMIGFVFGRKSGVKEGQARALGGEFDFDDDELI